MATPERIAVNADQVIEVIGRARAITDAAEAAGGSDDVADAIYSFGRWVVGWGDIEELNGHLADD